MYIRDLTRLVFSSIHTTCEDFRASFTPHNMISGILSLYLYLLIITAFIHIVISPQTQSFHLIYISQYVAFIVWAIGELEKFGTIFRNQVFRNFDDFASMGKCLEIVKLHSSLVRLEIYISIDIRYRYDNPFLSSISRVCLS